MQTIISIISLLASIITLLAVRNNVSARFFNYKHFKNGGYRITYVSGEYQIFNVNRERIYQSSNNKEVYKLFRGEGKIEVREIIKPYSQWNDMRKTDDIRVKDYPISLL